MAQTSAVSLPRTSRLQPELPQTTGTIAGIAGQLVLLRQPCLHIILSRVCADCLPSNRIQPSPGMRTLLKFTVFSRTRLPFSNCLSLNMTQLRAPLRVTIPKPRLERDSIIVIDPNSPSPSRIEKEGLKVLVSACQLRQTSLFLLGTGCSLFYGDLSFLVPTVLLEPD